MRKLFRRISGIGLLVALSASTVEGAPTRIAPANRARSAARPAPRTEVFVEMGSQFANQMKVTQSATASRSLLGTHQLYLSFAAKLGRFRPEIGMTPIARTGKDDTHRSRHYALQLPMIIATTDRLTWKAGLALWLHNVSGSGGDLVLNDGTGSSTFSKPGRSSTARTFAVTGGLTTPVDFHSRIFLDADLGLLSPLSMRRSAHLLIQIGWKLL